MDLHRTYEIRMDNFIESLHFIFEYEKKTLITEDFKSLCSYFRPQPVPSLILFSTNQYVFYT